MFNFNPYLGHVRVPCLLLRRPIANTAERTQNLFAYTISWVTKNLQWFLVTIICGDVSVLLTLV